MSIKLTKRAISAIHKAIDKLFDKLKARFIGPQSVDKKIVFGFHPEYTLRGLFEASAKAEGTVPSEEVLGTVLHVADNYIEAYRDISKAKVVKEVQSFLNEAEATGVKTDTEKVLGGKLSEVYSDVTDSVSKVVEAETNTVKNVSALDGIVKINAYNGISDPVVYFAVVHDEHLCLEENETVLTSTRKKVKVGELRVGDRLKHPTTDQGGGPRVLRVERRAEEVVELEFENGKKLVCTKDHPIMVRAGPTYCFIEAGKLRDDHDIVFADEVVDMGRRQAITHSNKLRPFMNGYIDAWDFWRSNIDDIAEIINRTHKRKDVLERYGISVLEWDRYCVHVIKAHYPNIRIVGGVSNNNFNDGVSIAEAAGDSGLSVGFLRKRLRTTPELLSAIKARGGRANWDKNRARLIALAIQRGAPHLRTTPSRPETKLVSMLRQAGIEVEQGAVIGNMKVDALVPACRVIIEYDGSGHDMRDRLVKKSRSGRTTAQIDFSRDKRLKDMGYRVLRIHDPKDSVPDSVVDVVRAFICSSQEFLRWHV